MNCYYRQDQVSVGVCRNCLKGICSNCAVDIGGGIACKNNCETHAKKIVQYLQSSMSNADSYKKIYAKSGKGILFSSFIVFAIGLVYILFPFFYGESDGDWFYYVGGIFIFASILLAIRYIKFRPIYQSLSSD